MRRMVVFFLVSSTIILLVEGCFWSRDYGGDHGGYFHHGYHGHHDRLDYNQQSDEPYAGGRGPLYYQNPAPQLLPPPPAQYQPQQQLPQGYPLWYKPEVPVLLRLPNAQTVVIPVKAVYSFPSFIERLVQRIQTYYSVYNPPESLTLDRPIPQAPTPQGGEETQVSVQEEEVIVGVTEEASVSQGGEATAEAVDGGEGGAEAGGSEAPSAGQDARPAGPTTKSPAADKEPDSTNELEPEKSNVSTLAVFEVSPTTLKPLPEPTTEVDSPAETTTDADNYISPEGLPGSRHNSKFEIHSEPHQGDTSN